MQGKHISLINMIKTVCLAYHIQKNKILNFALTISLQTKGEKVQAVTKPVNTLYRKLTRACNQWHVLITRLELTLHNST